MCYVQIERLGTVVVSTTTNVLLRVRNEFFIGVDLGQTKDYTVIAVLDGDHMYRVRHLVRERGIPYPTIVSQIHSLIHSRELRSGRINLVLLADLCRGRDSIEVR